MNNIISVYGNNNYFDFDNIWSNKIDIKTIAHALSMNCRFGGHCNRFYSIARHSINCAHVARNYKLPTKIIMTALLHDASEAYLHDMVKPLKRMLIDYQRLEAQVELLIAKTFNLEFIIEEGYPEVIKKIDTRMLITERNQLFDPPYDESLWPPAQPYESGIGLDFVLNSDPTNDEKVFLLMFNRLTRELK